MDIPQFWNNYLKFILRYRCSNGWIGAGLLRFYRINIILPYKIIFNIVIILFFRYRIPFKGPNLAKEYLISRYFSDLIYWVRPTKISVNVGHATSDRPGCNSNRMRSSFGLQCCPFEGSRFAIRQRSCDG